MSRRRGVWGSRAARSAPALITLLAPPLPPVADPVRAVAAPLPLPLFCFELGVPGADPGVCL